MRKTICLVVFVAAVAHPALSQDYSHHDQVRDLQNQVNNLQNTLQQRQWQADWNAMVRQQAEFINRTTTNNTGAAAAAAPAGPSADEIADAIVRKQNAAKKKADPISTAKDALSACRVQSTWFKQ